MSGTGGVQLQIYEGGGYMSDRAVWWLIYGRCSSGTGSQARHRRTVRRLVRAHDAGAHSDPHDVRDVRRRAAAECRANTCDPRLPRGELHVDLPGHGSLRAEGYARTSCGDALPTSKERGRPARTQRGAEHEGSRCATSSRTYRPREALLMARQNATGVYGAGMTYMASVADRIGAPQAANPSCRCP